ncbi:hypothetical protein BDY21DRAFT_413985 [Lineolata rhizophorae]|uniref:Beta-lactamase superfamily domain-containing protein n=1 Tax=Lineolata rhizophorae TaxID=578093 RepID=A0A6A6P6S7_9PEZI|nr:hypothetical protein BDY21DRAFT_413985 [Lineolata rhizophorae]
MSLTVRALNGDTSFLLTFAPSSAPPARDGRGASSSFPGSFTILIDPWLYEAGPAKILSPRFSVASLPPVRIGSANGTTPPTAGDGRANGAGAGNARDPSVLTSLADLPPGVPDLVLISQDKPDHCHLNTLRTLPRATDALILAAPAAARKIRRMRHFAPSVRVLPLPAYDASAAVVAIDIPPPTPSSPASAPGQVTVARIRQPRDVAGVHDALAITYRAPTTVLSLRPAGEAHDHDHDLSTARPPISAPLPIAPSPSSPLSPSSSSPSPTTPHEPTLSVLYAPHGIHAALLRPYLSAHLVPRRGALPLTCLLHSFDEVRNPWWMGGAIAHGAPGGAAVVRLCGARAWLAAHDAVKRLAGLGVARTVVTRWGVQDVRRALRDGAAADAPAAGTGETEVVSLEVGEEFTVSVV